MENGPFKERFSPGPGATFGNEKTASIEHIFYEYHRDPGESRKKAQGLSMRMSEETLGKWASAEASREFSEILRLSIPATARVSILRSLFYL